MCLVAGRGFSTVKLKKTSEASSLHYMFVQPTQVRTTRQGSSNKVNDPRVDSVTGMKAFSDQGPVFLNSFDNNLKQQENRNTF